MDGIIYLTDIDKSQIREGKNGKYIPVRIKHTPNSQYNDCMIKQRLGKEANEAGHEDPIIGNCEVPRWLKEQMSKGAAQEQAAPAAPSSTQVQEQGNSQEDLPF